MQDDGIIAADLFEDRDGRPPRPMKFSEMTSNQSICGSPLKISA